MKFLTDSGRKLDLIFLNGRNVLVDYYSDWIEFDLMKNQTACEAIDNAKTIWEMGNS